jgi:hypothetical protein
MWLITPILLGRDNLSPTDISHGSLAAYLATHSEYVICNVNYRLLSENNNATRLNEIVNDAFGAVLGICRSNVMLGSSFEPDATRALDVMNFAPGLGLSRLAMLHA